MGTHGFVYGSPRTNTSWNIQYVTCWDFLKTPQKLLSCDAAQTLQFLDNDLCLRTLIFHTRPAGVHRMSPSHLVWPHPSCWTCRNRSKKIITCKCDGTALHLNAALHIHLRKNLKNTHLHHHYHPYYIYWTRSIYSNLWASRSEAERTYVIKQDFPPHPPQFVCLAVWFQLN